VESFVRLRTAVPLDDGQAGCRQHRGPVAGHCHRTEGDVAQTRAPPSARSRRSTTIYGLLFARAAGHRGAARIMASISPPQTVSQMVDQIVKLPEGQGPCCCSPPSSSTARANTPRCSKSFAAQGFRARAHRRPRARARCACRRSTRRRNTHHRGGGRQTSHPRPMPAQRLSESLETAFEAPPGAPRALTPYENRQGHETGRRKRCSPPARACPVCGYSVATLEPKMFSFNSPAGALPPPAMGIGLKDFFDPLRVVAYPHLSLAGGAIKSWDRKNSYYFALITAMAKHYKFDPENAVGRPVEERRSRSCCSAAATTRSNFVYVAGNGRVSRKKHRFEGIIPEPRAALQGKPTHCRCARKLAKYLGSQPCPRLQGHAPSIARRANVFVGTHSLPEIAHLTVGDARKMFGSLDVAGWARGSRRQDRQGSGRPPAVPGRRGPRPISRWIAAPNRCRAVKRSAFASRARWARGLTGVMYILDEPSIGLHQRDNQRLLAHAQAPARPSAIPSSWSSTMKKPFAPPNAVLDIGPGAGRAWRRDRGGRARPARYRETPPIR